MRKKTATLAHPATTNATSETKTSAVSALAEPSPNGQPVSEEAIRLCAYGKWEAAGKPGGDGVRFWVEAEQELSQAK
jgi:hypothetical protein